MATKTKEKLEGIRQENKTVSLVPLDLIDDNVYQPRRHYPAKLIDELAFSISQHGLRNNPEGRRAGDRVQLAHGHVRVRAYRKLAKSDPDLYGRVPMFLEPFTDAQMFYFAMEENLRRGDLTPIEIARSIERFLDRSESATEKEVADKLNMTQSNVSNMLRVLRLPPEILDKVDEGRINFTMARELLVLSNVPDALSIMREAIKGVRKPDSEASYQTGQPCTVEGMQKSIHYICSYRLPSAQKSLGGYLARDRTPLFDTGPCTTCEKTVRTHPAKEQTAIWCTDSPCWQKKQKAHMSAAAQKAVQKAVGSITRKITDDISQEIGPEQIDTYREVIAKEMGLGRLDAPRKEEEAASKQNKPEIPEEIRKTLNEKAGTRAQVLDINDLRTGTFGVFRDGYVKLDELTLSQVADPEECTEKCTAGFHYAFDSAGSEKVLGVCGNPKCLGKKKGAFTRARNAAGHALKKAEKEAIRLAMEQAAGLERPSPDYWRLLIYTQMAGERRWSERLPSSWWVNKLGLEEKAGIHSREASAATVIEHLKKWSASRLFAAFVECSLELMLYEGEPADYECATEKALGLVGITIQRSQSTD